MNSLGELIKTGMKNRSLNEFSRQAGISAGNLSRIIKGQRPSAAVLKKIADNCTNITFAQLLSAAGYADEDISGDISEKGIPIYGTVAGGLPINAFEDILGFIKIDYDLGGIADDYFALKVRGNSMDAANMPDGSIIISKHQDTINEGEIGVFIINGDATVKRFSRSGGYVVLLPQSTDKSHKPQIYDESDCITVLGKVVKSVVDV